MDLTTFQAERRTSQDSAIDRIRPSIEEGLEQHAQQQDDWTAEILAAVGAVYFATHAAETGGLPVIGLDAFLDTIGANLALTTVTAPGDERAEQVERMSLWLGVAAVNAATFDAATETDPLGLGVEWVTMNDDHVRHIHREVRGDRRTPGQPFNVDGFDLLYPGQPVGPPHIWIGCRCSLRVLLLSEEEQVSELVASVAPDYAGGMVAFKPTKPDQLVVDGGDPPEDLHVTMAFLGDDVSDMPDGAVNAVHAGAKAAARLTPTTAKVAGVGRLGDADPPATVLFLNGEDLARARSALLDSMSSYGTEEFHPQHEPYIAHLTLGFGLDPNDYQDLVGTEFELDRVDVHMGGNVTTYQNEREEESAGLLPWNAVLVVEDTPSGDRRLFESKSLTWRDLPLPFMWQKVNAEGHAGSVVVGRIDEIWREGDQLRGRGVFNDSSEAREVIELRRNDMVRGVSVDADSAQITFDEENELVRFTAGRIAGATIVPIPAFQEATLNLEEGREAADALLDVEADAEMTATLAEFAVTDKSWNGDSSRFTPEEWRKSTILHRKSTEGQDPLTKSLHSLPILEPNGDLNRNAVHAAAGRINQVTNATSEEIAAAKKRLRSAYNRLNEDPPESVQATAVSLVAAGVRALDSQLFADPELSGPTPLTVDGEHVFGHLAIWGTCHTGFPRVCKTPPHSLTDYAYFRTGVVDTDAGELPIGQITLGSGHARGGLTMFQAMEHYANTATAVADVTAGEDDWGIWFSGALRDITPEKLRELKAAPLSGDWRMVRGHLELMAALCVNLPGYPVPRTSAAIQDGEQVSLVAAGIVEPGNINLDELNRSVIRMVNSANKRLARIERAKTKMRVLRVQAARNLVGN